MQEFDVFDEWGRWIGRARIATSANSFESCLINIIMFLIIAVFITIVYAVYALIKLTIVGFVNLFHGKVLQAMLYLALPAIVGMVLVLASIDLGIKAIQAVPVRATQQAIQVEALQTQTHEADDYLTEVNSIKQDVVVNAYLEDCLDQDECARFWSYKSKEKKILIVEIVNNSERPLDIVRGSIALICEGNITHLDRRGASTQWKCPHFDDYNNKPVTEVCIAFKASIKSYFDTDFDVCGAVVH